ncbi:MAG: SgcJ/EcaC family oxidoreductase [Pirellulaceae bacterium]
MSNLAGRVGLALFTALLVGGSLIVPELLAQELPAQEVAAQEGVAEDRVPALEAATPAIDNLAAEAQDSLTDEERIYSVIESYVKAFNAGDAEQLAEYWAEQGEYISRTTGERVRGREEIRALFAEKFEAGILEKGQRPRLEVEVALIRFVTPDVGLEEGIATIFRGDEDPQELTYTTVFVREEDSWKIDSIRETLHGNPTPDPENSASPLHELAWLIGAWRDESEDVVLETECRWATNESFLVRSFRVEVDGVVDLEGTQVLGWNAADETIRGWVFDSDGGFASERWHREEDKWWIEGSGTLPDGRKASSQRCLRVIDADSYEIHTTGRSIEGEIMPDIGPFVVRRRSTVE